MLTGRSFWRSALIPGNDIGVMREIAHEPVPIASMRALELGAGQYIPRGFDEWFAQCVALSPNERFVHANAAYAALKQALAT
jgi:hypothetical protein